MNENTVKFDKKHFFIVALTIFIFSVCDFLVAYFFQDVLKSPFFFDTIFIIAALFLFGPIASLIEYILFISFTCIKLKILYGKTDFVFLYTLSAFTIILVTWLFIRKKENLNKGLNLTFLYILTASVVAGLSCSVVSGFINYYFANCLFQIEWNFNIFIFAFNFHASKKLRIKSTTRIKSATPGTNFAKRRTLLRLRVLSTRLSALTLKLLITTWH